MFNGGIVTVFVTDMDRSVRFYTEQLGLKLLQRYRYLRADYIHAFVGGNKTRLIERLNGLYREPNCYLSRPGQQRQYFNANYRALIYELDRNGERALPEQPAVR